MDFFLGNLRQKNIHMGENKITHIEENKNPLRFYLLHSILVTKFVA